MKITANQYARGLYEATKDKSHKEIDGAILAFRQMLSKSNQVKLVSKIIDRFSEICNRENGIVEAKVISREKLNDNLMDKIEKFVKDKYAAQKVVLISETDGAVKGGIIIKVGDEVMDASIEGKLKSLRNKLIS